MANVVKYYPVPVYKQTNGFIRAEDAATNGATVGVNLWDQNGNPANPDFLTLRADLASAVAATNKGSYLVNFSAIMPKTGYFTDDTPGTRMIRFRDRVLMGDAVKYTGRRTAPYGGDWLTENGASYFIKNSQVAIYADETEPNRYGLLVAARGGGIGLSTVILNESGAAGRAIYSEAMHKGTSFATVAMEMAVSNYTTTDTDPNAYSMAGARGLYIAAFEGAGYTIGNSNTPVTQATLPPAAAIDIAGYSTTATRFRKGIVFRNGGLYRGTGDGSAGEGVAIAMAQQHALVWDVSSGVRGTVVRSDVSTSGHDTGLIFKNDVVQLTGTGEFPMMEFVRDTAGAGAVNNVKLTNSRTAVNPKLNAQGSDTNVGLDFQTKGTGVIRFLGQAGASESLRCLFNNSYVNFLTATGGIAAAPAILGAAGSDTNIDLQLSPKGTGVIRYGYASTVATTPANFTADRYLAIKDSSGTTYYIPARAATW